MEYRLYTSGGMEYLVYFSTLVYRTIREHQPNAQFQPDKILYPTDLPTCLNLTPTTLVIYF
jgi:hypothetical protein